MAKRLVTAAGGLAVTAAVVVFISAAVGGQPETQPAGAAGSWTAPHTPWG